MRRKVVTPLKDPLGEWHRWFAWFPVVVKHRLGEEMIRYICWLETVKRKRECFGGYDGVYCIWLYELEREELGLPPQPAGGAGATGGESGGMA